MSYLYILKSIKYNRSYTGVTENIEERLKKHNKGEVKSTKYWRPWMAVHIEEYSTLTEAKKREWFLKCTPQGGKEKREILKKAGIPAQGA
jgi:putative endonuclease